MELELEEGEVALGAGGGANKLCDSCGKAPSKYCCPGCSRRSCSLDCVKAHKEATGCNGKRDRTAFVGRGHWNERHLLSDYRFLEEVKLADDVAKRSRPPAPKQELPQFLQTLIYQARRRGVQLHILAPGMAKRVQNSTRFDARQKLLRWHVGWSFVGAGCTATDQRVHENTKVGEILRAHLTLKPGEALKHHQLRQYVDASAAGTLSVVLRKERTPANAPEYCPIDLNQVLSKQLAGKVIVEYPTFLVLLPHEVDQYPLAQQAQQTAEHAQQPTLGAGLQHAEQPAQQGAGVGAEAGLAAGSVGPAVASARRAAAAVAALAAGGAAGDGNGGELGSHDAAAVEAVPMPSIAGNDPTVEAIPPDQAAPLRADAGAATAPAGPA